MDAQIEIQVPETGKVVFKNGGLTVRPDQDREFELKLNLPKHAPNGDFKVVLTALSPPAMTFDDCSFSVQ